MNYNKLNKGDKIQVETTTFYIVQATDKSVLVEWTDRQGIVHSRAITKTMSREQVLKLRHNKSNNGRVAWI